MPYVRSWMVMMSMCLVFTDAFATHMKGGELTYEDLGGGQYLIRLVVYRDCGSNNANGTGFDVVAPIGIFNSSGQLINSISIPLSFDNIEEIAYLTADTCTAIPASLCIQQATYDQQVELGVYAGGLTMSYQRCCRTPALVNLMAPDDTGVTLTATIPGTDMATINSSPAFTAPPVVAMCLGQPFAMNQSATDQDGDSLAYSLCSPLLGGSPNQPVPNPPNGPPYLAVSWAAGYSATNPISSSPPITIDAVTGQLSGTPNQAGEYAMAICVEEWRDGVLLGTVFRDFHASVFLCGYVDTDGDGICDGQEIPGCLDPAACNYDSLATDYDLTLCDYSCYGCMDSSACNFDLTATIESGTCIYPDIELCEICVNNEIVDGDYDQDGICDYAEPAVPTTFRLNVEQYEYVDYVSITGFTIDNWCFGCVEMSDPDEDGIYEVTIPLLQGEHSFFFIVNGYGEIDALWECEGLFSSFLGACFEEDPWWGMARKVSVEGSGPIVLDAVCFAECSDCGSQIITGCTFQGALNFDSAASFDDGSCQIEGCMDPEALNFVPFANVTATCIYDAPGCFWDPVVGDWDCSEFCPSDINQDGLVGVPDLLILLGEFAGGCG